MPIRVTCPHCGKITNVADRYAGHSDPCAGCGQTITIPVPAGIMSSAKANRVLDATGVVLILLAAVLLGVFFVSSILPLLGRWDEERRKAPTQCTNNVKQIGFAILSYEKANGHFPPAFVADKNGKPMHSWRVLILPYLGHEDLYKQYRMDEPWNSAHNIQLMSHMPTCYRCASAGLSTGTTTYAMLVGPHAFSVGPTGRKTGDIKDGASFTIMVVEAVGEEIDWLEPRDVNAETFTKADPNRLPSDHPGGFNAVFCDGHVQQLHYDIDAKVLRALTTTDGGEQLDKYSF